MSTRRVGRRDFVRTTTLAAAALALPRRAGDPAAAASGPFPSVRLRQPALAASAPARTGVVDVAIEVPAAGDGALGPTVAVRKGDLVLLRLRHAAASRAPVTLDAQGLHVAPRYDRTTGLPSLDLDVEVPPGAERRYALDLWSQPPGTTALYEIRAPRAWPGAPRLVGVVTVADDPGSALAAFEPTVVVLGDETVNAQANPWIATRPGAITRLRIANASTTRVHRLALDGHLLHVVGVDGGPLDRSYPARELLLAPGERVDVLVQASGARGIHGLRSLPRTRGFGATTLLTLVVEGAPVSGRLPVEVNPYPRLPGSSEGLPRHRLAIGEAGPPASPPGHRSLVDTAEVWDLVNTGDEDVVWRQRVHSARVLAWRGGDASFAGWAALHRAAAGPKDTLLVPARGGLTVHVAITRFPGETACTWRDSARSGTMPWLVGAEPLTIG
jgi:FtsP/CotA-like multicopper oxidase with cupredoxin domain